MQVGWLGRVVRLCDTFSSVLMMSCAFAPFRLRFRQGQCRDGRAAVLASVGTYLAVRDASVGVAAACSSCLGRGRCAIEVGGA